MTSLVSNSTPANYLHFQTCNLQRQMTRDIIYHQTTFMFLFIEMGYYILYINLKHGFHISSCSPSAPFIV